MGGAEHNTTTPTGVAATATTTTHNAQIPQARAGGAPARIYMNERIVPYLLEGMKAVARDQ